MANKVKTQVKYDPSLTDEQRAAIVRNLPFGKVFLIFVRIFLYSMVGLFVSIWITAPFSVSFFKDDDNNTGVLLSSVYVAMLSTASYSFTKTQLNPYTIKNMRSTSKGCFSITEAFASMPATRLLFHRMNFKSFAVFTLLPTAIINFIINTYSILFKDGMSNIPKVVSTCNFSPLSGCIGASNIITAVFLMIIFLREFSVQKLSEKQNKLVSVFFVVVWLMFMWLPLADPVVNFFNDNKFFEALSGFTGYIILAAAIIFIFYKEKYVYEKEIVNAPWFE